MTDREQLIELILNCERVDLPLPIEYQECLADQLLANGVIVPPCKVGDKVYIDSDTWEYDFLYFESTFIHSKHFLIGEIVSIIKTKKQLLMKIRVSNSIHTRYKHRRYTVNALGVTVFLTKEEVEAKLKELGE